MFPTSSDGTNDVSSIGVEGNVVVREEGFIAICERADVRIKQEEIPGDINFPGIKSEPDEVSYVCVCLLLDILPLSRNVSCFCDAYIAVQLNQLQCWNRKCSVVIVYFRGVDGSG
jgi:hypothetical protein